MLAALLFVDATPTFMLAAELLMTAIADMHSLAPVPFLEALDAIGAEERSTPQCVLRNLLLFSEARLTIMSAQGIKLNNFGDEQVLAPPLLSCYAFPRQCPGALALVEHATSLSPHTA
eukprot:3056030-Rhodomonas_salina.1